MCYIFGKQGVQGYQISHSEQSTGQLFVGKPDQTRPDQTKPDQTGHSILAEFQISSRGPFYNWRSSLKAMTKSLDLDIWCQKKCHLGLGSGRPLDF